jgi:hypothetical protein
MRLLFEPLRPLRHKPFVSNDSKSAQPTRFPIFKKMHEGDFVPRLAGGIQVISEKIGDRPPMPAPNISMKRILPILCLGALAATLSNCTAPAGRGGVSSRSCCGVSSPISTVYTGSHDHYSPCYFRLHGEDYFVCDLPVFPCPKVAAQ